MHRCISVTFGFVGPSKTKIASFGYRDSATSNASMVVSTRKDSGFHGTGSVE